MILRRLASGEVYASRELAELARVSPPPAMPVGRPLAPSRAFGVSSLRPATPANTNSDLWLLEALEAVAWRCDGGPSLYPREREAFGRMLADMREGRFRALSYRQRAWAQEVGARVGIPGVEAPGEWRDFG